MGRGGRRKSTRAVPGTWGAALLVAAVVAVYANSLAGSFVLDDQAAVVQNPSIRDFSRLSAVLRPPSDTPVAGRPLVNLSFAATYAASGLEASAYRAGNIALHLVCVLLAWALLRATVELPRVRDRLGDGAGLAFAAALLWAVHPLNSEVVNYVAQRTESMMAACYLLTMIAAVRAATSVHAGAWTAAAVAACLAGTLCKESIATAPLLVALYDRVFLFDRWRTAIRARWPLYLGLAASWLVLAAMLASNPRGQVAGFSTGVSSWTYLLNQAGMIVEYLRLAFWPDALVAFYGWPEPMTLREALPEAAIVLALLAATALAMVRAPLAGYAGAWFFATLAPASSIVPVATEVGAERRMYLPLLGLIVLVVAAVRALAARAPAAAPGAAAPRRRAAATAAALVAATAALGAVTTGRNREYSSPLRLAETIVERRPTGVSHHMLGEQLSLAGRDEEAVDHLRQAVALGNSRAGYPLGVALFNQGRAAEAVAAFEDYLQTVGKSLVPRWLEPPADEVLRARTALGLALLDLGEWSRAAAQAETVLATVPAYPEARRVLAEARYAQERWTDAVREYRRYVPVRPQDVEALLNLGVALVGTGDLDQALVMFRQAVAADPSNPRAKELLAMAEKDLAETADSQSGEVSPAPPR